MRRLRITSNGSTIGTRIFDADTGEELMNVTRVRIEVDVNKSEPTVWLEVADVELDIVATEVAEEDPAHL